MKIEDLESIFHKLYSTPTRIEKPQSLVNELIKKTIQPNNEIKINKKILNKQLFVIDNPPVLPDLIEDFVQTDVIENEIIIDNKPKKIEKNNENENIVNENENENEEKKTEDKIMINVEFTEENRKEIENSKHFADSFLKASKVIEKLFNLQSEDDYDILV